MRRSPANRPVPGMLLLVLMTLSTGLPSHHHNEGDEEGGAEITAADHHDHGVILTEQETRLPSAHSTGVAIPARLVDVRTAPVIAVSEAPRFDYVAPREWPPPSASPRAPPVSS